MKTSNILLAAATVAMTLTDSISSAFAAEGFARSSVNIRSGPSTRYARVDALYGGEAVTITECRGNWCYITHNGPDGWVSARYLSAGQATVQPQRRSNKRNTDIAAAAIFGVIAGAIIASK